MMTSHDATTAVGAEANLDLSWIDGVIDACFESALSDYRINRFFNANPLSEQTNPLKALVKHLWSGGRLTEQTDLLDDCFSAAFARHNAKPSLVTGNDFAFLLDVIGGQEIRTITPLSACHSFLLKLGPDDFHYDVLLEHLQAAMQRLQVEKSLSERIVAFAESGREAVLGRLPV